MVIRSAVENERANYPKVKEMEEKVQLEIILISFPYNNYSISLSLRCGRLEHKNKRICVDGKEIWEHNWFRYRIASHRIASHRVVKSNYISSFYFLFLFGRGWSFEPDRRTKLQQSNPLNLLSFFNFFVGRKLTRYLN